ncbi:hypothetical protein [Trinickia acidisoli]|uniref:hypothetical protein n=1 Tax=Trinickia acidisoli TaxID=2767482 RepID=UPI001A8C61C4|nr:hypothetical protein [Trinickia acidisoli]
MLEETRFVPYKQTAFAATETGINVTAPWLSLDVDVDDEQKIAVKRLLDRIASGVELSSDAEIQNFLAFFADYPVLHAAPRAFGSGGSIPYSSDAPELMRAKGPKQFLEALNPFPDIDIYDAFSYFPDTWEWNVDEIAAESRIAGSGTLFDPISVYTAIRARRLQFQIEQSKFAHELLENIEALRERDESRFFHLLAIVLSQQFYVTRECCSCLDPAIEHLSVISDQIRAYKEEEVHHDRLILASIRELTDQPETEFTFTPDTKLGIEVIKYAAKTCALGFSALVSIMEGTAYPASDPVGDILVKSSKPSARIGVEAHFQINKRGNHTAIPETFVRQLPPVTENTVAIATRLAEVAIRLDSGLAQSVLRDHF